MSSTQPLALYVHIPFCNAKCTYCDFNSYAGQDSLFQPYAAAVAKEASLWAPFLAGRTVETVFFGGGTPSLLPLTQMQTIVGALGQVFGISDGAEFSLEANPGTVDLAHFQGLRSLGFNRVSFGVQSFHGEELRRLERIHEAQEVKDAYSWARQAGFQRINLDLIYGLEEQTLPDWRLNLETALDLAPEHLSLYALTLEEGTPLTRDVARGRNTGPDPDLQADMFEWNRERLSAAGFRHYEVSNWSRQGEECRHNLIYWRNGDWLGLGAGAHSHLFDWRFSGAASPSRYISSLSEGLEARSSEEASPDKILDAMPQVTFREQEDPVREMSETVALGLRLRQGLDLDGFEQRFGRTFKEVFGPNLEETHTLGLVEIVDGYLRLRDEAVLLGDEAFLRFLPDWQPA